MLQHLTRSLARLDCDWRTIAGVDISTWGSDVVALRTLPTPDSVVEWFRGRPDPDTADEVLLYLIGRAQGGDDCAAMTVLCAMRPKLVRFAASGSARDCPTAFDDLLSLMWERIMSYPLERRRRSVAANLALDTMHEAVRLWRTCEGLGRTCEGPGRSSAVREVLVDHRMLDSRAATEESVDVEAAEVLELVQTAGWLEPEWLAIVEAVYTGEGLSSAEAGREFGMLPATIRSRCSRSLRILRAHRSELLAA